MPTVTIPKNEYKVLKEIAKRYQAITRLVQFDIPEESINAYKNAAGIRKAYTVLVRRSSKK